MTGGGVSDAGKAQLLALFNAAVQLHSDGKLVDAVRAYEVLLQRLPEHPDVTDLLGTALFQLGLPERGRPFVLQSLNKRPIAASPWNHLGAIERSLKADAAAANAFRRSVVLDPGQPDPYVNLASLSGDGGAVARGLTLNRWALCVSPGSGDARLRQGVLLSQAERMGEALEWLSDVWREKPGNAEIALHLARALVAETAPERARPVLKAALLLTPAAGELLGMLSAARKSNEPGSRDITWARAATFVKWADPRGWGNLAAELYRDGRLPEAREAARCCLLLDPISESGLRNLTSASINLHAFDLCRRVATWASVILPTDANVRYVLAELEFRTGDLRTAWRMHESRLGRDQFRPRLNVPPAWKGPGTEEGTLLIASEQGIGDEVIFLSCLPEFIDRIRAPIVIEVDRRLVRLIERSFPGVIAVPRQVVPGDALGQFFDYAEVTRQYDVRHVVYQGSLPLFLDRDRDQPLARVGYLKPDPAEVERWRHWLKTQEGGSKVGVVWRTAQLTRFRAWVHCTIDDLVPVFRIPDACFINLMFGDDDREADLVRSATGRELIRPPGLDVWEDIDGLAALMAALDAVVAARTANYAFAAAVGVPTIRLAQSFMHIAEARDFFFPNARAVLDRLAPFDGPAAGRNAATLLAEVLDAR